MSQPARLEGQHHNQTFAMAPGSCACRSFYVNTLADPTGELDEAPTKTPIPPKALTLPLVPPPAENLFTKFMKVFIETTQAQTLAEPREHLLKARTLETYWSKSHMEWYNFY